MASRRHLLALAALCGALGCAPFEAQTPPGFVSLADQDPLYDYRATTHDGVVLAVRVLPNDPVGDEAFWSQAVALRLRHQGGYALLESRAVQTASGLPGRQLRFGHDEGTRPHLYQVTLFVTRKRIYLLEAGGAKALVDREAPRLDGFVSAFEARRCLFGGCTPMPASAPPPARAN
jgi:hypothetical protein